MNIKKILTITILAIFVVGMIIGAADAAHTFTKGKYQMKVTDKEYNKLKKSKPTTMGFIYKKVGTKTVKKVGTKTVKIEGLRHYYTKNDYYKGTKIISYHKKYQGNENAKFLNSYNKIVRHYNKDGSYYQEGITYERWRITKKVKKNIWMAAYKHPFNGDNKIYVSLYDSKPFSGKQGIFRENCGTC